MTVEKIRLRIAIFFENDVHYKTLKPGRVLNFYGEYGELPRSIQLCRQTRVRCKNE